MDRKALVVACFPAFFALVAACSSSGSTGDTPEGDATVDAAAEPDVAEQPDATDEQDEPDADDDMDASDEPVVDAGPRYDAQPLMPPLLTWTYYTISQSQCLDGTPAGFGVSANPSSSDLLIYLEGGGACFNDSCDLTTFNTPFVPPGDGIFNRGNATNPVADWNMVYVPYCTGDIHGGDEDTMVAGAVRHFHGYSNITKYLARWVPTFPNVKRVMLAGISAGGFGAGLNIGQIIDGFGPGIDYVVLDDSGPPLSKNVIPPCLAQTFRSVWGLEHTFLAACGADCTHPDDFARDWLAHVARAYPSLKGGFWSNGNDTVIRTFMGFGWGNGMYDDCKDNLSLVPGSVYQQDLVDLESIYRARFSTYYIDGGIGHTVLRGPGYYTTSVGGVSVPQWVQGILAGNVQHVGP